MIMLVCERQRWSRAQFLALAPDEQMDWIAWEIQRRQERDASINEMFKGKPYAEQITARALIALVRNG